MKQIAENFRDRDYWIVENTLYTEASFRLRKCARILNQLARNRDCALLDVGCGPAALRPLLSPNIRYCGIDIAIHEPSAHLKELDIARKPIDFDGRRFDFVVGLGFFEYMGDHQNRKLEEIKAILKDDGKFMMSYINFGHFHRKVWPNYNNVRSISEMTEGLKDVFRVERCFPASHHLRQKQPGKYALPALQMHVNWDIPVISRLMAVEYFFICSQRRKSVAISD